MYSLYNKLARLAVPLGKRQKTLSSEDLKTVMKKVTDFIIDEIFLCLYKNDDARLGDIGWQLERALEKFTHRSWVDDKTLANNRFQKEMALGTIYSELSGKRLESKDGVFTISPGWNSKLREHFPKLRDPNSVYRLKKNHKDLHDFYLGTLSSQLSCNNYDELWAVSLVCSGRVLDQADWNSVVKHTDITDTLVLIYESYNSFPVFWKGGAAKQQIDSPFRAWAGQWNPALKYHRSVIEHYVTGEHEGKEFCQLKRIKEYVFSNFEELKSEITGLKSLQQLCDFPEQLGSRGLVNDKPLPRRKWGSMPLLVQLTCMNSDVLLIEALLNHMNDLCENLRKCTSEAFAKVPANVIAQRIETLFSSTIACRNLDDKMNAKVVQRVANQMDVTHIAAVYYACLKESRLLNNTSDTLTAPIKRGSVLPLSLFSALTHHALVDKTDEATLKELYDSLVVALEMLVTDYDHCGELLLDNIANFLWGLEKNYPDFYLKYTDKKMVNDLSVLEKRAEDILLTISEKRNKVLTDTFEAGLTPSPLVSNDNSHLVAPRI